MAIDHKANESVWQGFWMLSNVFLLLSQFALDW